MKEGSNQIRVVLSPENPPKLSKHSLFEEVEREFLIAVGDRKLVAFSNATEFSESLNELATHMAPDAAPIYGVVEVLMTEDFYSSTFKQFWKEVASEHGLYMCPRCGGFVPKRYDKAMFGEYPGALSRWDNKTFVCSECGMEEAIAQMLSYDISPRGYFPWKKEK